ncbi:MAG: DUF4392 domain-containing protein [Planctomycetes bacterium]|nr:DUF4392 domain-containing protein [Planctomycetota bacterium]
MNDAVLQAMRDLVQEDVGNRGLARDPAANLLQACAGDFAEACRSIAATPKPAVGIVTGFYIPRANPPAGETDGPLGAIHLARAWQPLGIRVSLLSDGFCMRALQAGLAACGLDRSVTLVTLPESAPTPAEYVRQVLAQTGPLTHLIALERVGPSHTLESLQAQRGASALGEMYLDFLHDVPPEHQDRCHTMRGLDISVHMSPAHQLFEKTSTGLVTIGIGDGGNEIGMGKIAWDVIRRNIPQGGLVACRVPTDHLIVCGISNWGAYALGAGVRQMRGAAHDATLFDPAREGRLLRTMVEAGPLVDGVSAVPTVTVDGQPFDRYVRKLVELGKMAAA